MRVRYDRLLLKGKHAKGKDKSVMLKNEFKKVQRGGGGG